MSGPNPPESGAEPAEPVDALPDPEAPADQDGTPDDSPAVEPAGEHEAYSQAYSAPDSEQFMSGPYVPVDPRLYDYDTYEAPDDADVGTHVPRWPWVVGVTVIVAAIALVVSVALLFVRTETQELAGPATSSMTTALSLPPVQDEITTTTTTSPPPPPPTSSEEPPPPSETAEPTPVPVEPPAPEPTTTTAATPTTTTTTTTTTTPARPLQVTYTVTGTKAPFDQITITYIDASGQRRTQRNAYIPWSLTLTPISQSEVGSVEASSMLRLSKLNCSITSSDGTVLSSNTNDAPQTSC